MKNKKYKKIIALILAAVMVLGFAACGSKNNNNGTNNSQAPKVDPEDPTAKLTLTLDEWPVIDGATAMLPYYQEMAARILGISSEEAKEHVLCNTTTLAYQNLAEGKADMIFCAPPSDEQIEYAKSQGVEFESMQVLNSGFVFFVNKSNPVNNLSSQQLHDIYAGKITNWKEVGGNDEPIIAYQRSEGSGSQTGLFQHVIPKEEVMEALTTQRIGAMAEIIDAVANYDNAQGALGYSYYYYVTNMHYQEDVKLIAIDNIYPTPETITSDMYPYISKTCAVFNANEPEGSVVRKIAAWCHGTAGVAMSAELGYVPSGEEYIIPGYGSKIKTHDAVGMVKGNNLRVDHVNYNPDESGWSSQSYVVVTGLKNESVEANINKTIYDCFTSHIEGDALLTPEFENYDAADFYCYSDVRANFGNLLSVILSFTVTYHSETDDKYIYKPVQLNFDLRDGKLLEITDLFKDKENGMNFLNAAVYDKINDGNYMEEDTENWWDYSGFLMAAPFTGLKEDQKFFLGPNGTINLVLDENTPEFYLTDSYAVIEVDGLEIIDFDQFESKDSLFIDETETVHLFQRAFQGSSTSVELTDYVKDLFSDETGVYPYSVACLVYDELTETQKAAMLAHKDEFRQLATEFVAKAKELKQKTEFYGSFGVNASASRFGRFTNISQNCYGDSNYSENGDWKNFNVGISYNTVFEEGNDTPLSLEDVFKDGVDYKSVIAEGIYKEIHKRLEENGILEIPSDSQILALARDAAENIKYFGLQADNMVFYYDDAREICVRNLGNIAEEEWIYTSYIANVDYSSLDCSNIKIFMIK